MLKYNHVQYRHAGRISQHPDSWQQQPSSSLVEIGLSQTRSSCSLNQIIWKSLSLYRLVLQDRCWSQVIYMAQPTGPGFSPLCQACFYSDKSKLLCQAEWHLHTLCCRGEISLMCSWKDRSKKLLISEFPNAEDGFTLMLHISGIY